MDVDVLGKFSRFWGQESLEPPVSPVPHPQYDCFSQPPRTRTMAMLYI